MSSWMGLIMVALVWFLTGLIPYEPGSDAHYGAILAVRLLVTGGVAWWFLRPR